MFGHDGSMAFGGLFIWIFWLILLVLVVVIIHVIIIGSAKWGSQRALDENPLDILRKRYERGEIDE